MPRKPKTPKPTRVTCPKCGEIYNDTEIPKDELRFFFLNGCGSVLGTTCDGGREASVAVLDRIWAGGAV